MFRLLLLTLLDVFALSGCDTSASATFSIGEEVGFSSNEFPLPEELREETPSGSRIMELPCGPAGQCPMSDEVTILCEADLCNPEAQVIEIQVGDVIDIDALAGDADRLFRTIDTVEILSVDFLVRRNTLTMPTEEIELFWGPVGAVRIDEEMGVERFGVIPAIAQGETGEGQVQLDAAGLIAFTNYFENVAHRFRFFGRSQVDLEPGGPFPGGDMEVAIRMQVRISGSLI